MNINSGLQVASNSKIARRIILILLVGLLLITEQATRAFSPGAAAGGILGGFAAFMVLAHFVHQRHERARGEHDLDIDTTYGPAAKRYMRDKVESQRIDRNKHSKHHREQNAHRNKRLERQNRANPENSQF